MQLLTSSIIGGGLRIVQDVPPYIMAAGEPLKFIGINSVGLRRTSRARKENSKYNGDIWKK